MAEKTRFLPTSLDEGKSYYKNFSQFDVIFITGDPYYDHPLNGAALLARLLDSKGYKVAIISQPQKEQEFKECGSPRFFFCISSGFMDSMLANYTPMLKKRKDVLVPERALIAYAQKIKELFKGSITIIGGLEATIRRFSHFDYKDNKLRRSILHDSKADLLFFGNAERSLLVLLKRFREIDMESMRYHGFEKVKGLLHLESIEGCAYRIKKDEIPKDAKMLPSFEDCGKDMKNFNLLTKSHYLYSESSFVEQCGKGIVLHNMPQPSLSEQEMDYIYALPFLRRFHPGTKQLSLNRQMTQSFTNSVVIGRGCFGGCNFCVIPLVQGKQISRRSKQSILKEVEALYAKGEKRINDLTLPSMNMYGSYCLLYNVPKKIWSPILDREITVMQKKMVCNQQCMNCKHRVISNDLLPLIEGIEGLQERFKGTALELSSGMRHDLLLKQKRLFEKSMKHISRLKIAPEHISDSALHHMNKADKKAFVEFINEFKRLNRKQKAKKMLMPYFIAAHPGTTENDMHELKEFAKRHSLYVDLTQVFTPVPGVASTSMYFTGISPLTGEPVYVAKSFKEKKRQKNILVSQKGKKADY